MARVVVIYAFVLAVLPLLLSACSPRGRGKPTITLATTTSLQDSGLLDALIPRFEKQSGYRVKAIAVGTGAALALGAKGNADVVLVHAPDAERQWMADGNGVERLLVAYNDFVIVGPPSDPAGIMGTTSASAALKAIAAAGATWVSRDDQSGTDQLDKQLWKASGIEPDGQSWRLRSGQGMGATLTLANQKQAYTLADRGTWLAFRDKVQLPIMTQGDSALLNLYHVMPVNPSKFPAITINRAGAEAFAQFLVAPETQALIGAYGVDRFGQPLFYPAAGQDEDRLPPIPTQ